MSFTSDIIQEVWEKAQIVSDNDPNVWRKDQCGAWIGRGFYGNRNSQYGWEIDHISPGDEDDLSNLRPLQWENNTSKSDERLTCPISSSGINNKRKTF